MTTAYTSLLGLALPVTGELSGTWGDTVNASITNLLDTAIAGTTTLSADANVTLSTTAGAANQSRQAIILWTASGTVTRTITAPAQSKIYTIINRSATQSIKIVGVGPTTGITIKSGATVTVAWNGLDFVEISVTTLYPTVTISGNMDNGVTDNSLNNAPTVKAAVTTLASVYLSNPSTEAASFTLANLVGYRAEQGTIGATSTVTNQFGFYANSDLTGAKNNYGLYSGIAATAASTISSVNGTGSTVTVDTSGSHGLVTGDSVIIAGVSNTTMTAGSYNGGPYTITLVDSNTFTFNSSATSSAAVTSGGSVVKSNNWNIYAGGTGNNWFGGPTIKSVSSTLPALRITQTGTGDAFLVEDAANPDSSPFVINASGTVLAGTTTDASTQGAPLQVITAIAARRNIANSGGPAFRMEKSRATTDGNYTIVEDGDTLGDYQFYGADGAQYIIGASVKAEVDDTPSLNVMPTALVFSTENSAGTYAERMRLDSSGNLTVNGYMGVGTAANAAYNIFASGSSTTGANQYSVGTTAVLSGTSHSAAFVASNSIAASTAVTNASVLRALNITLGSSATITSQHGVRIEDLTSGTNNFGITSLVSSGANKWNIYASGTASNYMAGSLAIGTTNTTAVTLGVAKNITGATTSYGVSNSGVVQSDVTGNANYFRTSANTQATAFTLTNLSHYLASQNTIGAGSTVTNQYGFYVDNGLTGATNNYGFHSNIASAANRWNFYAAGTAANYFAGNVGIGLTSYSLPLSLAADGNGQNIQINGRTGDDFGQIFFRNFGGANNLARIASDNSAGLIFGTGSQTAPTVPTERMRIDSAGNVGIGTASPQNILHVSAADATLRLTTTSDTGEAGIELWDNQSGTSQTAAIRYNDTDNLFTIQGNSNGTIFLTPSNTFPSASEAMRIDSAGDVGIGTTAPETKLHIKSASTSLYSTVIAANKSLTGFGTVNYTATDISTDGTFAASQWMVTRNSGVEQYAYMGAVANSAGFSPDIVFGQRTASTAMTERMRIDSSGDVLVTSAAGLGYGTGAGGTVTQATSKSTAVTLNKPTGQITMNNAALGAGAVVAFVVNNSLVASTDTVILVPASSSNYTVICQSLGAGQFTVRVTNLTGGSFSEALQINFAIIKGATA